NYDLFQQEYQMRAEENQFHWYLVPLNQRGGIQTANELGDALRFDTPKDYDDWIARLNRFPAHMEQTIALMRQGMREHMVLPKIIMQRIPGQIEKQIVTDPKQSAFYKPLTRLPRALEPQRARLEAAAQQAIQQNVVPAFRRFHQFFTTEYLLACYDNVGVWQAPRGAEMYQHFIREHTTTELTPQQIHERGLAEVKRIRAEMEAIKQQAGFRGPLADFFKFLRTHPQFL